VVKSGAALTSGAAASMVGRMRQVCVPSVMDQTERKTRSRCWKNLERPESFRVVACSTYTQRPARVLSRGSLSGTLGRAAHLLKARAAVVDPPRHPATLGQHADLSDDAVRLAPLPQRVAHGRGDHCGHDGNPLGHRAPE